MNVLSLNLYEFLKIRNLKYSKIKSYIKSKKLFIFKINISQKLLNLSLLIRFLFCFIKAHVFKKLLDKNKELIMLILILKKF